MITKVNEQMMTQTDKFVEGRISKLHFIITYTTLFITGLVLTSVAQDSAE